MYIPQYAEVTDRDILTAFIQNHSFGTLFSSSKGEFSANHYPFLIENDPDGSVTLYTHIARSNPQWQGLVQFPKALMVFKGPHSYISPVYYQSTPNVPTWNYTAVHVSGAATIVSDTGKTYELMKKLVASSELRNKTKWDYDLPVDFHQRLLNAIVWLKISVCKIEGKFKLSQNRNEGDYNAVVNELAKRPSENNLELLEYMRVTHAHFSQSS